MDSSSNAEAKLSSAATAWSESRFEKIFKVFASKNGLVRRQAVKTLADLHRANATVSELANILLKVGVE